MAPRIVGLFSDFGLDDWYVGVMKGVILSVNPQVTVIDVIHTIPRHDVGAASFVVGASYSYLPIDAIVVAVVDPGVGTTRRVICAEIAGRTFLAPDNGLLSDVFFREGRGRVVSVENDEYFLKPVSSTFHGRDIFASVAGHLSLGLRIGALGPEIKNAREFDVAGPRVVDGSLDVIIRWVDSFGNLVTDCSREQAAELKLIWGKFVIAGVGEKPISMVESYESVGVGELLGIIGSSGHLEISVREGSAGDLLNIEVGSEIRLTKAGSI
ncbi:MAG: SAM-dependent chlorinase/fluorinase [Candidatus Eisenbacteria bacterium]